MQLLMRKRMWSLTRLLVFCLFTNLYTSSAFGFDDYNPFTVTTPELVNKFSAEGDLGFLARASVRCSAFLSILTGIVERDLPDRDVSKLISASENLYLFSSFLDQSIATNRKSGRKTAEIVSSIDEELVSVSEVYQQWFRRNYTLSGEYFGSSQEMKAEIELCTKLGRIASSKLK